jgi:hypothetical protein
VRLSEFLSDVQLISQGVIVGQGNWQQTLESNKQAYVNDFVSRPGFTSAYPASMTASQFVDALNANAGNPLSTSKRDQLVSDLSTCEFQKWLRMKGSHRGFFTEVDANTYKSGCEWFQNIQKRMRTVLVRALGHCGG